LKPSNISVHPCHTHCGVRWDFSNAEVSKSQRIPGRCLSLDIWFVHVHKNSERTIFSTDTWIESGIWMTLCRRRWGIISYYLACRISWTCGAGRHSTNFLTAYKSVQQKVSGSHNLRRVPARGDLRPHNWTVHNLVISSPKRAKSDHGGRCLSRRTSHSVLSPDRQAHYRFNECRRVPYTASRSGSGEWHIA
jgi:hypothetical protein